VGTESALDRSKPLKSFIMALFAESGNFDIEARPLPARASP
jgi:3-hydroxy-3-methylglutaryl CoA synthase